MADALIQRREELYDELRETIDLGRDHGVYLDMKIPEEIFEQLKEALTVYIAKSLRSFYVKDKFVIDENYLTNYEQQILNLPNRTPNGAFHPKRETVVEYNNLQKTVITALRKTKILDNCIAIQPCTVRVVSGRKENLDHTRPLATTKLHSDAWASHIGDAILGCPMLGDPSTSLEFYKPHGISEDFFLPLENYDEGLKMFGDKTFLGRARMGYISICDHACLHKTSLNEGDIRVSFDFGIVINNKNSLYYDASTRPRVNLEEYRYEYFDLEKYEKLGEELFISIEETMEEAQKKYTTSKAYSRPPLKIIDRDIYNKKYNLNHQER